MGELIQISSFNGLSRAERLPSPGISRKRLSIRSRHSFSSGFDDEPILDELPAEISEKLFDSKTTSKNAILSEEAVEEDGDEILLQTCKIAIVGAGNIGKSQLVFFLIFLIF